MPYVAEVHKGITDVIQPEHVRICVQSVLNHKPRKISASDFVYYHCVTDNQADTMKKFEQFLQDADGKSFEKGT